MDKPLSEPMLLKACGEKPHCAEQAEVLADAVASTLFEEGCDCLLYSGGIDTGFVLAAGLEKGWRPRLVSVLFPGAADEEYLGGSVPAGVVEHVVRRVPFDSPAVEECLDRVLEALKSIDPVEVSAGVSTCLGLQVAKSLGCTCVATGDAGDELFYGYSFLLDRDERYLADWLEWVLHKAFYSSQSVGEHLGVKVVHPLNSQSSKKLAASTPLECKIASMPTGVRVGKFLMRCYLAKRGFGRIAVRDKTPITSGSGVEGLTRLWSSKASLGEALSACREEGILLPSLAHVFLYRRYRELGLPRPGLCGDVGRRCPLCGSCLSERGYCRFCGAVVSGGGVSFHGGGGAVLDVLLRECSGR